MSTPNTTAPAVDLPRIVRPSFDDWHEAYEEAAGHLEYVAGTGRNEVPEGEREAMRKLAARLRSNARKLKRPN